MMIELHNVTIAPKIKGLSLTVATGELVCLSGPAKSGKTVLLKAVLGLIQVDGGHISIDGELLTPQSAPYFRRHMAYVPQHLVVPEDYKQATDYVSLLTKAIESGKQLLVVDEPAEKLSKDTKTLIDNLLRNASQRTMTVLAVNERIMENQVRL